MASMVRSNKMTRVPGNAPESKPSSKPSAADAKNSISSKRGGIIGGMKRPPDAHPGIPSGPVNAGNRPRPTPTPGGNRWNINPDTGEPIKPKGKF